MSAFTNIRHGFGTRLEPVPQTFLKHWEQTAPTWTQNHGISICEITQTSQDCGSVDVLTSQVAGCIVGVRTADCVPVLLSRKDGKRVAAIHAGWRGSLKRIIRHFFKQHLGKAEHPAQWVAKIGPAIGPCCFEVSEELMDQFLAEFSEHSPEVISPKFRHLDLQTLNQLELAKIGVGEIEIIKECTFCTKSKDGEPKYCSYRRDGKSNPDYYRQYQRQYSMIEIS